jgi:hypothetical protein
MLIINNEILWMKHLTKPEVCRELAMYFAAAEVEIFVFDP